MHARVAHRYLHMGFLPAVHVPPCNSGCPRRQCEISAQIWRGCIEEVGRELLPKIDTGDVKLGTTSDVYAQRCDSWFQVTAVGNRCGCANLENRCTGGQSTSGVVKRLLDLLF